jgi:predicted phage tail component-like protein
MANSFTYRGIDFSTYGLVVKSRDIPMTHNIDSVELHYKSFATDSRIALKTITLDVAVTAASVTTLKTNMDTIRRLLNTQVDEHLILDSQNDRYWNVRFKSLTGRFKGIMFDGMIEFLALDPCAYDNSEVSNDYTDDEDPETIFETPGGSAIVEPVFTLTSTVNDGAADIKVNNVTLGMEIEWTGAIAIGEELVIDCAQWVVYLEAVESMSTVSGQFPVLSPGVSNTLEIYGFTGNVNITYRNKYV